MGGQNTCLCPEGAFSKTKVLVVLLQISNFIMGIERQSYLLHFSDGFVCFIMSSLSKITIPSSSGLISDLS